MPNLQRLIEILESLRRVNHDECEDGFYSCPAHPGYFGNDSSGECNCGLVKDNALVDEALQIVGGLTKDAPDRLQAARWEKMFEEVKALQTEVLSKLGGG